jgi:hypothetical protein
MKRIKLVTAYADPDCAGIPGEEREVSNVKAENLVRAGVAKIVGDSDGPDPVGSFVVLHKGAGWYTLPDGSKVQGKDNAIDKAEDMAEAMGVDLESIVYQEEA